MVDMAHAAAGHADTAAFRLDGSLADDMVVRFADDEVNSGDDSATFVCAAACVVGILCIAICI